LRLAFRLPDGAAVESRDQVPFAALDGAKALWPVLYNPESPREASLLAALSPPVRLSAVGEWLAPAGLGPFLRLAVVFLALVGGPVVGLAFAVQ
jgi:hypothetical protein